MRLDIGVDIDVEEFGLDEEEVKEKIVKFIKNLLTIGAEE